MCMPHLQPLSDTLVHSQVLDLKHFGEDERGLGGVAATVFVPTHGVVRGYVAVSTRAVHVLAQGASVDALTALVTHDLPSITRVDVAVASQRLRVVCGRTFFDILIGDSARMWCIVQLLADVPMLSDCGVFVDDAFSTGLRAIVPEFAPPLAVQLGRMQDLIAHENAMADMQRICALAADGADGTPNAVRHVCVACQ